MIFCPKEIISVSVQDFKYVFNREPDSQEEYDEFVRNIRKGVESQLDWDIIYSYAGGE